MNKTAASAAQLAKCILLHAMSIFTYNFYLPTARKQTKTSYCLFNKLA